MLGPHADIYLKMHFYHGDLIICFLLKVMETAWLGQLPCTALNSYHRVPSLCFLFKMLSSLSEINLMIWKLELDMGH